MSRDRLRLDYCDAQDQLTGCETFPTPRAAIARINRLPAEVRKVLCWVVRDGEPPVYAGTVELPERPPRVVD